MFKIKNLNKDGSLEQMIPKEMKINDPEARLQKILTENKVILFLEGIPSESKDEKTLKTV